MKELAATWRHFDFWLLGTVVLLIIFGVTMIRSAVAGNIELVELNLVNRQMLFAGMGMVALIIVAAINYRMWASFSGPLYWIAVVFLALLAIVGAALYGSARWFDTGVILIQPSEIAKIVMVIVLADYFTRNKERLDNLIWVGRSFITMMGITVWILLQPNLSTSIVMIVLWASMLWVSGLRLRHLILFLSAGIVTPFLAFPFLEEYQQSRILNFLFPDPNARHGDIYNIQQALIAIGSGGFLGQGYGHGTLSKSALVRLHLLFDGSGVRFYWHCPGDPGVGVCHLSHFTGCPDGFRYFRRFVMLWRGYVIGFPGHGQYRCKFEPDAGYRPDLTICQLWGQFSACQPDRDWVGGKRSDAPPRAGILIFSLLAVYNVMRSTPP